MVRNPIAQAHVVSWYSKRPTTYESLTFTPAHQEYIILSNIINNSSKTNIYLRNRQTGKLHTTCPRASDSREFIINQIINLNEKINFINYDVIPILRNGMGADWDVEGVY